MRDEADEEGDGRAGVQSVEIGMRVLAALADAGGELGLSALARAAGMPGAKVHRYLVSLIRGGFVERGGRGGTYALGAQALRVGLVALGRLDVIGVSTAAIHDLRDRIDQTVMLAVWGTHGPTVVRWVEASRPVTVNVRVGSTMPLLRSATGQVFAAHHPAAGLAALVEREMGRDDTPESVRALLDGVRARGLGHSSGALLPGILALGAPVFGADGALAAVVTTLGPVGAFDDRFDGPVALALRDAAARLSRRLGHAPDGGPAHGTPA